MGDLAEGQFEQWQTSRGLGFERYGLSRPKINMSKLPAFIRYTPDYVTAACLVEVQGFGAGQVVKFKVEKLEALHDWTRQHDVYIFLYDSHNDQRWFFDIRCLDRAPHEIDRFPEGKKFYAYDPSVFDAYKV